MGIEKVLVNVRYPDDAGCGIRASAVVQADTKQGGITTGNSSMGAPNLHHYAVTVGGHKLSATWDDNACHDITAEIGSDHPLAAAIILIARMQEELRGYRQVAQSKTPIGWRADEWASAKSDARSDWARAKEAVESDPVAAALVRREPVEA